MSFRDCWIVFTINYDIFYSIANVIYYVMRRLNTMKKKIIAVSICGIMFIANIVNVYGESTQGYCGASTVFQNSHKKAIATTYCSYATSDNNVVTTLYTTVNGVTQAKTDSKSGQNTVQVSKSVDGANVISSASGDHYVFYRGTKTWEYHSVAPQN